MSDCCGKGSGAVICACSGAADVGFLSDRAARMLSVAGKGSMYCLAGVGADIESFIRGAKEAGKVIAVDGCPEKCGMKALSNKGIQADGFVVTELGYKKGEAGMSGETVNEVFGKIKKLIETGEKIEAGINSGFNGGCGCGCKGEC